MNSNIDEKSIITNWVKQINKPIFLSVTILMTIGLFISLTINPGTSKYLNNNLFSYFNIQALYLIVGYVIFLLISFINVDHVKTGSTYLFIIVFISLLVTLIIGVEIKGSKRWLYLLNISIMPIEILKPFFCVILGIILNNRYQKNKYSSYTISFIIFSSVSIILVMQPDVSQLFLISVIYFSSVFMSGFSIVILSSLIVSGIIFSILIYLMNFNVQNRINSFFFPEDYDLTQTELSLQAIKQGGLIGVGPGNGLLKNKIPEANSDYIFSVIAEEYGLIGCLVILSLFFIIAYQGFKKIYGNNDHFIQICIFTLIIYICLQALVHIGVNIRLIPTTGITLPFISYGGSSVLGMSISCGLILLLSKKNHIRE